MASILPKPAVGVFDGEQHGPASERAPTSSALNLQRLVVLRTITLGAQAVAAWVAVGWLGIPLPLTWLTVIFAAALGVNMLTWARLRRSSPVRDGELFAHLTFDVLTLTALLYLAGGSTNPFAPLYLLPLTLAAAALPWLYTWAMAMLTVGCYSLLLFFYVPLRHRHPSPAGGALHPLDDFGLHVFGMWLGFLLSAALIAYFAVRMRETLRERDRLRGQMREQELRHERLVALGTLAAGAAHELGTPLSTMAILTKELMRDVSASPEKLQTLRDQIARCKDILASLSVATGQTRAEGGAAEQLDTYLANLIERWRGSHPDVRTHVQASGIVPAPRVVIDQTLGQALLNILNNAAEASPLDLEIEAVWTPSELAFEVRDRGPGLAADVQEHAGEPFFTTKAPGEGMGLGLFLARGTLERLGGTVSLANRDDGGAVCRVQLPLESLRVPDR